MKNKRNKKSQSPAKTDSKLAKLNFAATIIKLISELINLIKIIIK